MNRERERKRCVADRRAIRRPAQFVWASVLLAAAAAWLVAPLGSALAYDRSRIAAGEAWRLLTGHLAHGSAEHLLWDVAAFAALGLACARRWPVRLLAALAGAAAAIPAALWTLRPDLATYRGLSGIDAALLALLATGLLKEGLREGRRLPAAAGAAALALLAGKILLELATGGALFVDTAAAGMVPVPLAHAVGAAAGLAAAALPRREDPESRRRWTWLTLEALAGRA